jgi:hypothetical protein
MDAATPIEATIGKKVLVVAVFEVSSVRKIIKVTTNKTMIQGSKFTARIKLSPSH